MIDPTIESVVWLLGIWVVLYHIGAVDWTLRAARATARPIRHVVRGRP